MAQQREEISSTQEDRIEYEKMSKSLLALEKKMKNKEANKANAKKDALEVLNDEIKAGMMALLEKIEVNVISQLNPDGLLGQSLQEYQKCFSIMTQQWNSTI